MILTHVHDRTGVSLCAVIADPDGRRWNGVVFEAYDITHVHDYSVSLVESPAGSYSYTLTFPVGIQSEQTLTVWLYQTSSLSITDIPNWVAIYRRPGETPGNGGDDNDGTSTGNGDIVVDHNWGGLDALRVTSHGNSVDDALITAYLTEDFNNTTDPQPVAQTRTGSDGRWIAPLMLDSGAYTIVFSATHLKPMTTVITIL